MNMAPLVCGKPRVVAPWKRCLLTTRSDSIRIVLADDHPLIREGARRILEQEPDFICIGEAGDGETAFQLIERCRPDIAVLDICMPGLNGVEVVRRAREVSPLTRALMMTAFDDDAYILALLELGVAGYLLKTSLAQNLPEAVRRVHRGEAVFDPAIVGKVTRFWVDRREAGGQTSLQALSSREREVLALAAKGLRNGDIALKLCLSVRTIEGHFHNIFNKLGVSSRMEAVLRAVALRLMTL